MREAPRLFCFGLGYSARALALRLAKEGWEIAGTTRTGETAAEIEALGFRVYRFDRGAPLAQAREALAGSSHLLSSVPPDDVGDPVLDLHGADIAACASLRWAGYLSTTGVYGDRGGGWVDEESALLPSVPRGRRRLQAEQAWSALLDDSQIALQLFRLAGIYGPGRNALATVRRGAAQRIDKPGQVFSRIHVDDIASVLAASIGRPSPGRAYNLCDDDPAAPAAVIAFACELLGRPPPPLIPFDEAELSPMARSFYRDNKRVCNRRIKQELGVTLAYPNYRTGLQALLAGERPEEP